MAVFRVEKNKGYTVMSNYHLNDKTITLKAKGLLSQMLSLPESWDYTLKGLAYINKESVDAIRTAVLELEQRGYIVRQQGRAAGGGFSNIEYTIYEQPQEKPTLLQEESPLPPPHRTSLAGTPLLENPITAEPILEKPILENPIPEKPLSGNPTQLNTKEENTDLSNIQKLNMDLSSTDQSIYPSKNSGRYNSRGNDDGRMEAIDVYREMIHDNLDYEILCERYGRERMDEIVSLILDTVCSEKKYIRIGGENKPAEVVKSVLLKLNSLHIEYVFECLEKNTTKVRNIRGYLLTALYNAQFTIDHYYQAEVKHDLYGGNDII